MPSFGRTRIPRLAEVQRSLPFPLHAALLHASGLRSADVGVEIQELQLAGQQGALCFPPWMLASVIARNLGSRRYYNMVCSGFDCLSEVRQKLKRKTSPVTFAND